MFIRIVETADVFAWSPKHEETGEPYASVFQLRILTDEKDKEIRKAHTRPFFEKKTRAMRDKLDESAYIAAVIDHVIVDWSGIQGAVAGEMLPCTATIKGLLPERLKGEILRLCAGKEAGEALTQEEKKTSSSISDAKPTAPSSDPAA